LYTYRSHHPCRARNDVDPELCAETWGCPEAYCPHLLGRGGSRRNRRAAHFQREQLEQCRRGCGEDEGRCGRARNDLPGLEDAGRESRVGICRCSQIRDLLGSRHHQPAVDIWGKTFFFPEYSFTADVTSRVLQPSLTPAPTVDDINTSQRELYDILSGAGTSAQLRGQGNWVNVAVVSEAHVRAIHAAAAGGHRIIVRSGPFFFQDLRKFLISVPVLHTITRRRI
jgi:hypothetical protein